MSRLPPIDTAGMNAEQKRVYDAIAGGPRGGVRGPFLALLHVPDLADRIQNVGEYLRFNTGFGSRLNEMAILMTARHFTCNYEWHAHEPHARKGGLPQDVIEAIRERRRPATLQDDEAAIYDFVSELLGKGKVSDGAYQRVAARWGTKGPVELAGVVGYYIMIAMTLLAHDVQIPAGTEPPLK
jgi:4-carboxymuconolactone decarboxylase